MDGTNEMLKNFIFIIIGLCLLQLMFWLFKVNFDIPIVSQVTLFLFNFVVDMAKSVRRIF